MNNVVEDKYIEEKLLSLLLSDSSVLPEAALTLKEEWFSREEYRVIYRIIIKHFKDYGASLSIEALVDHLKESKADVDINLFRNIYLYLKTFEVTKDEFAFLKDRLFKNWRSKQVLKEIENFLDLYEKGAEDTSFNRLLEKLVLLDSQNMSYSYIDRGEVVESFEERKKLLEEKRKNPQKYKGITTGIKALDDLTGGLWKGEIGCVFGKTTIGKSTLVLSFAREAYFNCYRVLYITEEMPLLQVLLKFDASLSRIEYRKFKEPTLLSEGEQKRWEYRMKEMKEYYDKGARLYVHHIPVNCTLDAIQREIEFVKVKDGKGPDMVIVDDLDMMAYPRSRSREEGMVMNARGLKSIAGKYNVALWFTKQLATSAYSKAVLDVQDLAFAKGVIHQADMAIGLQQTKEEKEIGRVTLQIVKFRDGPVGKFIYLSPDLSKALIHSEEMENLDKYVVE